MKITVGSVTELMSGLCFSLCFFFFLVVLRGGCQPLGLASFGTGGRAPEG